MLAPSNSLAQFLEVPRVSRAHAINPATAIQHRLCGSNACLEVGLEGRFVDEQPRSRMLAEHIATLWNRPQLADRQFPFLVTNGKKPQMAVGVLCGVHGLQPRFLVLVDEVATTQESVRVLLLLGLNEVQAPAAGL